MLGEVGKVDSEPRTEADGEVIPGLDFFPREAGYLAIRLHYRADEEKRDPEWERSARLGMPSAGFEREYNIDFEARGGELVYPMFERAAHVRAKSPTRIDTRVRAMDHGVRNPTTCLWAAILRPCPPWFTSDIYFYREYTRSGATIGQNCAAILAQHAQEEPPIRYTVIDRATLKRLPNAEHTEMDEYARHGVPAIASNSVKQAGRQAVYDYFLSAIARHVIATGIASPHLPGATEKELRRFAAQPAAWLSPCMERTIWELEHLRFKEMSEAVMRHKNPKDEEEDKDDHHVDPLRYLLVMRPRWLEPDEEDTVAVPRWKRSWRLLDGEEEEEDALRVSLN